MKAPSARTSHEPPQHDHLCQTVRPCEPFTNLHKLGTKYHQTRGSPHHSPRAPQQAQGNNLHKPQPGTRAITTRNPQTRSLVIEALQGPL